jgi:hypothetical protein
MKPPQLPHFLVLALLAHACTDPAAPGSTAAHAPVTPLLNVIEVAGPEDVPLPEGTTMPAEYFQPSLIAEARLEIGFLPKKAWATASMRVVANNARVSLKLTVRKNGTVVATDTTSASFENQVPGNYPLAARLNLSVPADCGLAADGLASYSVWMSFPLPPAAVIFTWGKTTIQDSGARSQPECNPGGVTDGGDGDWIEDLIGDDYSTSYDDEPSMPEGEEYEGQCELCQRWYLYYFEEVVASWWECTEIDNSYCEGLTEHR